MAPPGRATYDLGMSPSMPRHGRRPGPKPTFNLHDAIDAALEDGIRDFTIGGVAKRLGVAPSAIYRVVSDREGLVGAAISRIFAHYRQCEEDLPWPEQIRFHVEQLWRICEDHEGLAMVLLTTDVYPHVHEAVAKAVARLVRAGLQVNQALFLVDVVFEMTMVTAVTYAPVKKRTAHHVRNALVSEEFPAAAPSLAGDARTQLNQKIEYVIMAMERGLMEPAVARERELSGRGPAEAAPAD